jgi:uncharacterized protein YkwD
MMPSPARLASATAAGVVGLVVAGLILFGSDPLGTGSTTIAVPAPAAASGTPTASEPEAEPADETSAPPTRRASRPEPTGPVSRTPWSAYRPKPRTTGTYRLPTTYGPRPGWRSTRRPPAWPRPTMTTPTATTPPTATGTPTRTRPRPTPTRTSSSPTPTPTATAAESTTSSPTPTASPSASDTPTATPTASDTPTPSPTPTASATPTSASPTPSGYASRSDWAAAVLDRLNAQRASHGLPALTSDAELTAAAHAHNVRMAEADQLSHQLPDEPGLGARISAAGYSWSSVGENVAWNSDRSEAGVLAMQDSMYNETPPDDGHRRNILSTSFTEVGIDVIEDPDHGKVWLVTDFGRP